MKPLTVFSLGMTAGTLLTGAMLTYQRHKAFEAHLQRMDKTVEMVRAEAKTEIEESRGDYTPCDEEQDAIIRGARQWYKDNLTQITSDAVSLCSVESYSKNDFYHCDLSPEEVIDFIKKTSPEILRTQIFCPTVNPYGLDDTFGKTLNFANEYRPGQMVIYQKAFDEGDCKIAGTFAHELGHIATGMVHDEAKIELEIDWLYLFGAYVTDSCLLAYDDGEYKEAL